jgi:ADP-ribose pyrophosphatase YjhB (NUDIX family)
MVKFHLTGQWSPGQVCCRWGTSTFYAPPQVHALIERAWAQVQTRPGVQLFDGPMCRLESFASREDKLELVFSHTSYKLFLGTNLHHPEVEDQFGRAAMANPVGASCALVAAGGELMLGRRNQSVAYYPGRIHPFAGALEPGEPLDVFDEVRRELKEELAMEAQHIAQMQCLGLAEDRSLRQPEMIFLVQSPLTRLEIEARVDPKEHHSSTFIVPTSQAAQEALRQTQALTPVAVATILLWGKRVFGEQWFAKMRPGE